MFTPGEHEALPRSEDNRNPSHPDVESISPMCTRYLTPEQAEIERFWHIGRQNPPRWQSEAFPRAPGPFLRRHAPTDDLEFVVGQWGLVPPFAESAKLPYATYNARFEEIARKPSFRSAWANRQRCIIPAWSFDEPCWETGRNVW